MGSIDGAIESGAAPEWRKSSHSGGGNDCVEVAFVNAHPILRDSKHREDGSIQVDAAQWRALLHAAREGHFDVS